MKKFPLFAATLVLVSCSAAPSGPLSLPLQERMRNPLVAERYWGDLAEHMAEFARQGDPILKDTVKAAIIDGERLRALERVTDARALKGEGTSGIFKTSTPLEELDGEVLLRGNTLSFGPSFYTLPGPSVRVYLTTTVDPRDAKFPDPTSVDLGLLQTAYGPQEYAVPEGNLEGLRTAVLYDTMLDRIVGFAQLSK